MSSKDVGMGVEVDCGKLDQLLLSQPMPPAALDPSCAGSACSDPGQRLPVTAPPGPLLTTLLSTLGRDPLGSALRPCSTSMTQDVLPERLVVCAVLGSRRLRS